MASLPQVKTGPFAEHSNKLYGISGVAEWSKVNSGLIKMYKAEVYGCGVLVKCKGCCVASVVVVGVLYWLMSSCLFCGFIVVTATLLCHSVCVVRVCVTVCFPSLRCLASSLSSSTFCLEKSCH